MLALLQASGLQAHRNDQRYVGGKDNPDIAVEGWHIECKRCEKLSLYEAMAQATRDANDHATPAVIHRRNNHPWLVVLTLDDALKHGLFNKKPMG